MSDRCIHGKNGLYIGVHKSVRYKACCIGNWWSHGHPD